MSFVSVAAVVAESAAVDSDEEDFEYSADSASFVVAEFEHLPVDPFAGCVELELAVVHRIVASSVVDAVERESHWVADTGQQVHDTDCLLVACDTVDLEEVRDIAAAVVARDTVEQHLDDNFEEFHSDAALDSDPVKRKNVVENGERRKNSSSTFVPVLKVFCRKICSQKVKQRSKLKFCLKKIVEMIENLRN